jgi:predicted nucleic acid-binding protein
VDLLAPDHIRYELASAVTLATQGANARLTIQDGQEAIAEFLALGLTTVGTDALILAAYPLVHQFGIAIYDALYLALALQTGYPLITADGTLYDRIRQLPLATWVSDPRVQQ